MTMTRLSHPLIAGLLLACTGAASAQQIARLYAAQAPAGSAYVRLINPSGQPLTVEFGGQRETLDGKRKLATDYRVIDAAGELAVKADGKPLVPLALKAGGFYSVVLGAAKPLLISDATDKRNDLKAELRFYNLARDCSASLALQDGPAAFERIAFETSARRTINPVKAELLARCESAATSNQVLLPALKPGDHVSFFLTGNSAQPRLSLQTDATEAYSGKR